MARVGDEELGFPTKEQRIHAETLFYGMAILDAVIVLLAGVFAVWLRFGEVELSGTKGLLICLVAVLTPLVCQAFKLYRIADQGRFLIQAKRVFTSVMVVFVILLLAGYMTKSLHELSRSWIATWLVSVLLGLVLERSLVALVYKRFEGSSALLRRFLIVSATPDPNWLLQYLTHWRRTMSANDVVEGIFLDLPHTAADLRNKLSAPIKGRIESLVPYLETHQIDQVVILAPPQNIARLEEVLSELRAVSVDVDVVTVQAIPFWTDRSVGEIARLPSIRVMSRPLDDMQVVMKRATDIVLSVMALIFLAPLMVCIAIAIKLDSSGPVFFRQFRHGLNNQPFMMLKFRTMEHSDQEDPSVAQATRNDPRVTRVGRWLRKTSFDELPQFFNSLKGEMSVVGPRPHAIAHNKHYSKLIDHYVARHRIKPGITGLAQAYGLRGETDTMDKMIQRVEYDLYYVDNWSLSLDLKILLLTLGVLVHPNAY